MFPVKRKTCGTTCQPSKCRLAFCSFTLQLMLFCLFFIIDF
uniref:Uncharacterized protein n=1 Tax=Rhizophora mucronata TaxID=61149 RepID=A0A2P2QPM2_RHIMU